MSISIQSSWEYIMNNIDTSFNLSMSPEVYKAIRTYKAWENETNIHKMFQIMKKHGVSMHIYRLFTCAVLRYHLDNVSIEQKYKDAQYSFIKVHEDFALGLKRHEEVSDEFCKIAQQARCNNKWPFSFNPPKCFMLWNGDTIAQGCWEMLASTFTKKFFCDTMRHILPYPSLFLHELKDPGENVIASAKAHINGEDCIFALHDALLDRGEENLAKHFTEYKWHPKGCWAVRSILGIHTL